jgi:alcohol dehydrogenase class IV
MLGIQIKSILHGFGSKRILLIHGHQSFKNCGSIVTGAVPENTPLFRVSGFSMYPVLKDIVSIGKVIRSEHIDTILAIGGGTIIDIAKSVSVLWHQEEHRIVGLLDRNIDFLLPSRLKLLVIPTTCGTGAEATPFAVIYNGTNKHSFYGNSLVPQSFIHCPDLTASLSTEQLAIGTFDTLSQSIESIWSKGSTAESKAFAGEAVQLVLDNIDEAIKTHEPAAMTNLMKASFLSGKAIAITKTTGPHALSYPLTKKFGIPHGLAVMITLPYFFLFHDKILKSQDDGYCDFRQNSAYIFELLKVNSSHCAFKSLLDLAAKFTISISLSSYIDKAELFALQDCGFNEDRILNHPVVLNISDIQKIFAASFERRSATAWTNQLP